MRVVIFILIIVVVWSLVKMIGRVRGSFICCSNCFFESLMFSVVFLMVVFILLMFV